VPDVVDESSAPGSPASRRAHFLLIWLLRVAGLGVAVWATVYGLRLRNDLWTWSTPIRFTGDIGNAIGQGNAVLDEAARLAVAEGQPAATRASDGQISAGYLLRGFVRHYDTVVQQSRDYQYNLDYTPARLLVMSFWARYVRRVDPRGNHFAGEDARPLLRFNTGCEIAAALFMFLLVRHWVRRGQRAPREWAWVLGLIAALVSWFNPSTLADAHIWPQWDVWIVPFYLAAMYFASTQWWFAAGMSLAIGAMFKGQLMMVAPVLALWPLFAGRWSAAIRIVIGFLFAAAMQASPWLARNPLAWAWIGSVLLASVVLVFVGRYRAGKFRPARRVWPLWSVIPIIALVVRPIGLSNPAGLALGAAVAFTPWMARHLTRRGSAVWLATIMTACICMSAWAFAGSWSWLSVGFEYPTRHFLRMENGGSSNLPALLGERYQWQIDDLAGHLEHWDITIKALLISIYAAALILCAVGAALHGRRNDPRILISLTAPWVLMFTILPQMHERYLMWGAALCGVAVASSLGMSLMHLVVIGLSTISISHGLLSRNPIFSLPTFRFLNGTHPGIAWMLLLAAATYQYMALLPRRRESLKPKMASSDSPIDFRADRSYAWDHANKASEAVGPAGAIPADSK